MTASTPNPLWDGLVLGAIGNDYIHLGTEHGPALMVLRHLPLYVESAPMHPGFCDRVGQLLCKA